MYPWDEAKKWAEENGYILVRTGGYEANALGLNPDVPMREVFWTDGPSRFFGDKDQVEVQHVTPEKLQYHDRIEGRYIRAFYYLSRGACIMFRDLQRSFDWAVVSREQIKSIKDSDIPKCWKEYLDEYLEILGWQT